MRSAGMADFDAQLEFNDILSHNYQPKRDT